jgi:hypothetical protein
MGVVYSPLGRWTGRCFHAGAGHTMADEDRLITRSILKYFSQLNDDTSFSLEDNLFEK